jgi:hypothetical protein
MSAINFFFHEFIDGVAQNVSIVSVLSKWLKELTLLFQGNK